MQSRPHTPRGSALVLVFALIISPFLAAPAAAVGPAASESDLPGLVHGYLAELWSGLVEILSPAVPGLENGVLPSTDGGSSDDGTSEEEEDDCDTDGSCGLGPGGIGSIMDPNG